MNPVLCVFEKLAYKVSIFHKKLAEFQRFMGAVLIEFSLRHPGSLHESSLTEVNPVRELRESCPVSF